MAEFFVHHLTSSGQWIFLPVMSANAFAQQSQPPAGKADAEEKPRGPEGRGGFGHHGMFGILHELNLTDDQKQQVQAIIQRYDESTKAQREELQQLREKRKQGTFTAEDEARARELQKQLHESMKSAFAEVEAILTPEQKARLDELKKKHEQNQGQRGHEGNRSWPGQSKPPTQP